MRRRRQRGRRAAAGGGGQGDGRAAPPVPSREPSAACARRRGPGKRPGTETSAILFTKAVPAPGGAQLPLSPFRGGGPGPIGTPPLDTEALRATYRTGRREPGPDGPSERVPARGSNPKAGRRRRAGCGATKAPSRHSEPKSPRSRPQTRCSGAGTGRPGSRAKEARWPSAPGPSSESRTQRGGLATHTPPAMPPATRLLTMLETVGASRFVLSAMSTPSGRGGKRAPGASRPFRPQKSPPRRPATGDLAPEDRNGAPPAMTTAQGRGVARATAQTSGKPRVWRQ